MNDAVTIKEIARIAGVSIGTVDRVLHNRGRVADSTRRKIQQILKETGYKGNVFASALSRAAVLKIGIILPRLEQNEGFWGVVKQGMDAALDAYSQFRLQAHYYYFDRYKPETILPAFAQFSQTENNALLLTAIHPQTMEQLVRKLSPEIPLICTNADLENSNRTTYVGQDSFASGITAGRMMELLVPGSGNFAVITVQPRDYHINQRAAGFKAYFQSRGDVSITSYHLPDAEEFTAFDKLCTQILEESKQLNGLFVPNCSVHFFAAAMREHLKRDDVKIIGYDLIRQNAELLARGWIDFLINQQPYQQGYLSVQTAFRATMLKEATPEKILLPIEIIAKENLQSFQEPATGQAF